MVYANIATVQYYYRFHTNSRLYRFETTNKCESSTAQNHHQSYQPVMMIEKQDVGSLTMPLLSDETHT